MINAIVSLSEKQQQAENMLIAVTKELAEAKKLIASLKQERNIPISPIHDYTPMQPLISNSSLSSELVSVASPDMPILPKQNSFVSSDLQQQQRWNANNHNVTMPPNTLSQSFSNTTPVVNIPSRTEVAALAQERKKKQQDALKQESSNQTMTQWNISMSVPPHPVNSIK